MGVQTVSHRAARRFDCNAAVALALSGAAVCRRRLTPVHGWSGRRLGACGPS